MYYLIISFFMGFILNLFIFFPHNAIEIYPEFHSSLEDVNNIKYYTGKTNNSSEEFHIHQDKDFTTIYNNGKFKKTLTLDDSLYAFSGNGKYYIKYEKVGKNIEFFNIQEERFWNIKSREYPYISNNARLIFLLNGDQSKIRIIDKNSNSLYTKKIVGRLCNIIYFTPKNDIGAIGFIDGTYYIIDAKGIIISKGTTPKGNIIKGLSVNNTGSFCAIHYGNTKIDFLRIKNIQENQYNEIKLESRFFSKSSIHVDENGYAVIIEKNRIIRVNSRGNIDFKIKTPAKKEGFSSISFNKHIYTLSYTMDSGNSKMIIFKDNGDILLSKNFNSESFLKSEIKGNLIFLRGSHNLYCYSFHN